ncbi:MAG: ROK family protein [Terrimicrobiaceae bacterium]|nr:ROK family protein [Terrimicrobiaceae bacterium]
MSGLLWGIGLGGPKIEGAVLDGGRPHTAVHRPRRETGASRGYDFILPQIAGVVRELEEASGMPCPQVIGTGTPGAVEPSTGTLKNSNTTCLNHRPLREDLTRLLSREIRMANDANCFALAEATRSARRSASLLSWD